MWICGFPFLQNNHCNNKKVVGQLNSNVIIMWTPIPWHIRKISTSAACSCSRRHFGSRANSSLLKSSHPKRPISQSVLHNSSNGHWTPPRHAQQITYQRPLSTLSLISSWIQDVMQERTLNPKNPILSDRNHALPEFNRMMPYHLKSAATEAAHQYKVKLAELEVGLTGVANADTKKHLLEEIKALEYPVHQLIQVGNLYCDLASTPDKLQAWRAARTRVQKEISTLPWRESKVIYKIFPLELQHISN